MFLWLRCHHSCLLGQLLCSSSCHPSSEERSCIASKVGFSWYLWNLDNLRLTVCNISLSFSSTKNQITLHSCPRFVILNARLTTYANLFNAITGGVMFFLFSDWHRATISSFSGDWNDKENSKFHCRHCFLFFHVWICPYWLWIFNFQKEGRYKGRKFSSVCHFFGYQARGSIPSNFDCDYAYVSIIPLYSWKLNTLILMATLINIEHFRLLGVSPCIRSHLDWLGIWQLWLI